MLRGKLLSSEMASTTFHCKFSCPHLMLTNGCHVFGCWGYSQFSELGPQSAHCPRQCHSHCDRAEVQPDRNKPRSPSKPRVRPASASHQPLQSLHGLVLPVSSMTASLAFHCMHEGSGTLQNPLCSRSLPPVSHPSHPGIWCPEAAGRGGWPWR